MSDGKEESVCVNEGTDTETDEETVCVVGVLSFCSLVFLLSVIVAVVAVVVVGSVVVCACAWVCVVGVACVVVGVVVGRSLKQERSNSELRTALHDKYVSKQAKKDGKSNRDSEQ